MVWVANNSQIFGGLFCTPYKVVKIKHPFGMLQSNIHVLQDLVGFFIQKHVLLGQKERKKERKKAWL